MTSGKRKSKYLSEIWSTADLAVPESMMCQAIFRQIQNGVSLLKIPNRGTVTVGPWWRIWREETKSVCVWFDLWGIISQSYLVLATTKTDKWWQLSANSQHASHREQSYSWNSFRQATLTWKLIAWMPRLRVTQNLGRRRLNGMGSKYFKLGMGMCVHIVRKMTQEDSLDKCISYILKAKKPDGQHAALSAIGTYLKQKVVTLVST